MDLLKNLFKGDRVIWIIFLCLCVISIIEVFSAASTLTYKSGDHWGPITHHVGFLIAGTLIVFVFHIIPYKWFQAFPLFLLPLSCAMLAFVTIMGVITGDRTNGAARWLTFMGFQFQPSELAKMAVVIVTAFILSKGQSDDGANPKAFKYIMIITGVVCLLIAPENLSTAMLLFGVVVLLMIIGQVAWKKILLLFAVLGIMVTVVMSVPSDTKLPFLHRLATWKSRIINFTKSEEVPAAKFDINKDAQVAHSRIAISKSHVIGKGPGNSVQRDFLSQAFSDFIFAIIIEELGLIGGGFVVMLYIWLLIRAGRIAQKCKHTFPALLVIGIALLLVSQALLNMMVAVGLFPVTGQPLPLISKGGTSTLINCMYIGIILSVSCYTARLEKEEQGDAEGTNEEALVLQAAEPTGEIFNNDSEFDNK